MNKLVICFCLMILQVAGYCQVAFPGAQGFGSIATGGRGGKVIYVTNLNISGPGSLQNALNQSGPRYILFKVSGVISGTIHVPNGNGNFTIAGQTSPDGIIVRGFEMYNENGTSVSNVIIRHLRSRIGDRTLFPSPHWIAEDGITVGGVHRAIFDHCSFAHASDEAVDISRSSNITFQNCILAETLGGHADLGGMLINYSSANSRLDSISIHHNVWNRIGGRMPEISCETPFCNGKTINIELSNNLFWDPKIELWYEGITGFSGNFYLRMNAVNNLYHAGPQYFNAMYHFDLLHFNQNMLFFSGNKMNLFPQYNDYQLFYCCNDFNLYHPNTETGNAIKSANRFNFPIIDYTPTEHLKNFLAQNVGAFPRDVMDNRLMGNISNNTISNVPIHIAGAHDAFQIMQNTNTPMDTDGDGMPDYWELMQGLNPMAQDHNLTNLSVKITGVPGYTNLECYLNCLSDALVQGQSSMECGIKDIVSSVKQEFSESIIFSIIPNPAKDQFVLKYLNLQSELLGSGSIVEIMDLTGKVVYSQKIVYNDSQIITPSLAAGVYLLRIKDKSGFFLSKTHKIVILN